MVGVVRDRLAGSVCDPACGTGGFLLAAARFAAEDGRPGKVDLLGFEVDERLAWVTRMNLSMHDVRRFSVVHLDGSGSLGPGLSEQYGGIDLILTNPPFGSDVSDAEALAALRLGEGRASRRRGVLFIERCLELLKPGGLLAIVIDEGVLNGPSNKDTRKLILEQSHPFAIVSLPETAFMPYAAVKASILFLQKRGSRRRQPGRSGETFFASANVVGKKPNGDPLMKLNRALGRLEVHSDFARILAVWRGTEDSDGPSSSADGAFCFWAKIPNLWDRDFKSDGLRLDLAYHHPSRHRASTVLQRSPFPLCSIGELCGVRNDAVVPARDLPDEDITFVGLANIEARTGVCTPSLVPGATLRSAVRRFISGDILFARMRPGLRKVCLVTAPIDEGFASGECVVLVPKRGGDGERAMLPALLAMLLRSDLVYGQLVHMVMGIGRPRVSKGVIMNVRLPVPPLAEQRRVVELYQRIRSAADGLRREGERAVARAEEMLDDACAHEIFHTHS